MNEKQVQENQQELFDRFSHEPQKPERSSMIAKNQKPILISTTLEQILLISLVTILVFCLIFYLGVLRGRSMVSGISQRPVVLSVATVPARHEVSVPTTVQAKTVVVVPMISGNPKKESPPLATNVTLAKPYTIQVLTTKKKAYAESEAMFLRNSGFNSQVSQSGDFYVVCVGTYANKEEAKKDISRFSSKYKNPYLRRNPKGVFPA